LGQGLPQTDGFSKAKISISEEWHRKNAKVAKKKAVEPPQPTSLRALGVLCGLDKSLFWT
jgi:hypothetical protein